jgi:hypothetical protein
MARVQLELTEEQAAALERRSATTGESVPALLLGLVDQVVADDERQRRIEVALSAIDSLTFRSGLSDLSENHDEYIGQALDEEVERWRR